MLVEPVETFAARFYLQSAGRILVHILFNFISLLLLWVRRPPTSLPIKKCKQTNPILNAVYKDEERELRRYLQRRSGHLKPLPLWLVESGSLPEIRYWIRRGSSWNLKHLYRAVRTDHIAVLQFFLSRLQSRRYRRMAALYALVHSGEKSRAHSFLKANYNISPNPNSGPASFYDDSLEITMIEFP